ncbi:baseplate J/gp47 family protein [Pelistega sp. MC2]|uniref:baseplate J/gp47 family protein n=1 Tax=Pelistega sp. MC2 TaxID=1720297 RepID=UPI0008DA1616|nr:baseplate J/gp47 family protein [Pelistega sp. MC2]
MATVTKYGIVTERLDEIIQKFSDGFRAIYGQAINIDPDSPDGQMIGLISQIKVDFEELLENVYKQLDPYRATGVWLEQRAAYSGIVRREAKNSYLYSVILTGDPYTDIPAGLVLVDENKNRWTLVKATQLNSLGSARGDFRSEELGAFFVKEGDSLEIETVIVGLNKAVAFQNAVLGQEEETDVELRQRLFLSHAQNAVNSCEAIRAKLHGLRDVEQVLVLENTSNDTDSQGVEGHSINAIIIGGDDNAIAEVIYENKGAGAGLQGAVEVNLLTEKGNRLIKFDRATVMDIYIKVVIVRETDFTQVDTDQLKAELANLKFDIGQDVALSRLYSPINKIDGFWVRELKVGKTAESLGTSNLSIGIREVARVLEGNVQVEVE